MSALVGSVPSFSQPTITSTPPLTANEGQTYNFEIAVSDPYGKPVVIDTPAMQPLPAWLDWQNPAESSTIQLVAGPTELSSISALAFDKTGILYLADTIKNMIFKVDTATGSVDTLAGTGGQGNMGDGGLATAAEIDPTGIAVDTSGNVFVSSATYHVIRRIDAVTNVITSYAGTESTPGDGPDGSASAALLDSPGALFFDAGDTLYFADNGNLKIKKIAPLGNLVHIAGNGNLGTSGDGGAATSAHLGRVGQLVVAPTREIYLPDTSHNVIRIIYPDSISTLSVGTPSPPLQRPSALALDWLGNVYVSDRSNNIIRKTLAGELETIAGIEGQAGSSGVKRGWGIG